MTDPKYSMIEKEGFCDKSKCMDATALDGSSRPHPHDVDVPRYYNIPVVSILLFRLSSQQH